MKNEEKAPILLYKIMSSKDLINRANISSLNNITKNHLPNISEDDSNNEYSAHKEPAQPSDGEEKFDIEF